MGLPETDRLNLPSKWRRGTRNLITDVPGVRVGNVTLQQGDVNTGVTALLPHGGNLFLDKALAATAVLNGFGKSAGLLQVEELGTIETPVLLTNTLSVGTALTALTKYMLRQNEEIGITTGTVNCLVTECNDGRLNDIRGMHVTEEHVLQAIETAGEDFLEGAVGGGTGMCCMGVKGGIGSASRVVPVDGIDYIMGALVMSNFGSAGNLTIGGQPIGKKIKDSQEREKAESAAKSDLSGEKGEAGKTNRDREEDQSTDKDQGSIIMILATDIPLNERQLKRLANRTAVSLGRTGSYMGNGSGDVAIAFTTANRVPHYSKKSILDVKMFYDENIDPVFEAGIEAVEEAVISSMYHAKTTIGIRGTVVKSLQEYL